MVLRLVVSRLLPVLAVAGFASAALPAQAQAGCSPCGYTAPQTVYVPQTVTVYVPRTVEYQYQPCGHCGNRGLFTSSWTTNTWTTPSVVYQQQYYQPETQYTEDDDDDYTYRRPRYHTGGYGNTTRRHFTTTHRTQSRQCGYINGKWTCLNRGSQQHSNRLTQNQPNRRTGRY